DVIGGGIESVCGPELERRLALELDRVDCDDRAGPGELRAHHCRETHAAGAEDSHHVSLLNGCALHCGPVARHHRTADERGHLEGSVVPPLDAATLGDDAA